MSRPVTVEFGVCSRSDRVTGGPRSRILTMIGSQAAHRIDGVFAIISGKASDVERISNALESGFRPSARTNLLPPGMEEEYLASLLTTLAEDGTSIALAIWVDWEMVVGSFGEAQIYVSNNGSFTDLATLPAEEGTGAKVHVLRFTPSSSDMVAMSSSPGAAVTSREATEGLRTFSSPEFGPQEAADWLVSQSADAASAVVVQFSALQSLGVDVPPGHVPASPGSGGQGGLLQRGVVGAVLAALLLTVAFLALHKTPGSSTSAPRTHAKSSTSPAHQSQAATSTNLPTAAKKLHSTVGRPVRPATVLRPVIPAVFQSWKFPALPGAPRGGVLVALYNPTGRSVVSEIRIIGRAGVEVRRVHVRAHRSVNLAIPSSQTRDRRHHVGTLYVQGQPPIVPLRVVVGKPSSASSI